MKMDKFCAGLVALVAGLALSAGNASATRGYVGGDPAMMKLVPYFETGAMKATIIGIQNLSEQEASTMTAAMAVMAAQTAVDAADPDDPTVLAGLEQTLADAMEAAYTEHVFVNVNVYDAMGVMMEGASTSLCLADHQFGYVVLQGPMMQAWQETSDRGMIFSADAGDIPAYGYVEIMAEDRKYTSCTADAGRDSRGFVSVVTGDGTDDAMTGMAKSMIAAWTIIQDTGSGFFGTEVPTVTISKMMTGDDASTDGVMEMGDPVIACYDNATAIAPDASVDPPAAGVAANRSGMFVMSRCGLIPERHNNAAFTVVNDVATDVDEAMTPRARAVARYDAMDDSMVYVWLAEGGDMEGDHPSDARMLDVIVKCEDGTVMTGMDQYGDPTDSIRVAAPGMVTMIDPTMGAVGDVTSMCAGYRGVLRITMPNGSHAGMVFSHITQMGGHYRMNFAGYSKANDATCAAMVDGDENAAEVALCMAP